jgi:hypothetical protein
MGIEMAIGGSGFLQLFIGLDGELPTSILPLLGSTTVDRRLSPSIVLSLPKNTLNPSLPLFRFQRLTTLLLSRAPMVNRYNPGAMVYGVRF